MIADLAGFYDALLSRPGLSNADAAHAAGLPRDLSPEDIMLRLYRETRCLKARYSTKADGWTFDDSPTGPSALNRSPIGFLD